MPLHHYGLPVGAHFKSMRDFYVTILKPLGYEVIMEHPTADYCGLGVAGGPPEFWLGGGKREDGMKLFEPGSDLKERVSPIHIAFKATSDEQVNEWYDNAIKHGAIDNGKPGVREQYMKGYYAAFVLDPLGNNIEVVHLTW